MVIYEELLVWEDGENGVKCPRYEAVPNDYVLVKLPISIGQSSQEITVVDPPAITAGKRIAELSKVIFVGKKPVCVEHLDHDLYLMNWFDWYAFALKFLINRLLNFILRNLRGILQESHLIHFLIINGPFQGWELFSYLVLSHLLFQEIVQNGGVLFQNYSDFALVESEIWQ